MFFMHTRYILSGIIIFYFMMFVSPLVLSAEQESIFVHFINVGQGDSILVQTPENKHILIDGGPPRSGKKVVQYLKKQNVKKIDLLIATHPDIDHIGGLINVLKSIPVKKALDIGKVHTTKTFMGYMYQLFKQKTPLVIAEEGKMLDVSETVELKVLNAYDSGENNNEASLVLQLSYGEINFLFMGDVGKEVESQLLDEYNLQADIMKIGHHGSKTSTSLSFLEAVNPQIAFITYQQGNKYGHPVDHVIQNLHRVDAQIFSTGVYGDTVVETDGEKYIVLPEKSPLDGLEHAK